MKNYLLFILLFLYYSIVIFNNIAENQSKNNYQIIFSFCDYKNDYFNTGIELLGKEEKIYSLTEGEIVFYNKNRLGNISYNNGNLIIIENKEKKLRFSYYNLKDEFNDAKKIFFKEGEEVGFLKYDDIFNKPKLFIEVEDIKNQKILNPLKFITINDTIQPIILDVYFITNDSMIVSLKKNGEYKVKRGGKIFVECIDKINNFNNYIVPYSIKILIDGIEKSNLIFDCLNKNNSIFKIGKDRIFENIYLNKKGFDFYIMDYYGLPSIIGFQVIIEDFNGNKSIFKKNLIILPPD